MPSQYQPDLMAILWYCWTTSPGLADGFTWQKQGPTPDGGLHLNLCSEETSRNEPGYEARLYVSQHFSSFSEYKIECSKVHPQTDKGQHEIKGWRMYTVHDWSVHIRWLHPLKSFLNRYTWTERLEPTVHLHIGVNLSSAWPLPPLLQWTSYHHYHQCLCAVSADWRSPHWSQHWHHFPCPGSCPPPRLALRGTRDLGCHLREGGGGKGKERGGREKEEGRGRGGGRGQRATNTAKVGIDSVVNKVSDCHKLINSNQ